MTKHWTEETDVICPDCGYRFGSRSLSGALEIALLPGAADQCKDADAKSKDIRVCARAREAIEAGEVSSPSQD
jgi:hypothetical protein